MGETLRQKAKRGVKKAPDLSELANLTDKQKQDLQLFKGMTAGQQRGLRNYAAAAQRRAARNAQRHRGRTPDSVDRGGRRADEPNAQEQRIINSKKGQTKSQLNRIYQTAAFRRAHANADKMRSNKGKTEHRQKKWNPKTRKWE